MRGEGMTGDGECDAVVYIFPQEQKRQDEYEEFLKEKLMIDEIVRKIYEEDQR